MPGLVLEPATDAAELVFAVGTLVVFLLVGLYLLWEAQGLLRDVAAMVRTRTSPVTEAREGRVELSGTARPARPAERTLTDPVGGEPALAYEYRVTQEEHRKEDLWDFVRWGYREAATGAAAVPFEVADETGYVLVDPGEPDDHEAADGALNLYATDERSVHVAGEESPPETVSALWRRADLDATDRARVYETATVAPGDEVYVLGTATFRDGERVVEGADGRFVVAGASQPRALAYNAAWGVTKFVGGAAFVLGCSYLLLALAGVVP